MWFWTLWGSFLKIKARWAPFLPEFSGRLPRFSGICEGFEDFHRFCPGFRGFCLDFHLIKTLGVRMQSLHPRLLNHCSNHTFSHQSHYNELIILLWATLSLFETSIYISYIAYRPVVFNLFCSITPLQELFFKISPPTYDFSVGKNIILIWNYFNANEIKRQFG